SGMASHSKGVTATKQCVLADRHFPAVVRSPRALSAVWCIRSALACNDIHGAESTDAAVKDETMTEDQATASSRKNSPHADDAGAFASARAEKAQAAWQFFQQMVADLTKIVTTDAESERELLEGLRLIARVSSLCSQMAVEADVDRPSFFDMCSENRMVGGP